MVGVSADLSLTPLIVIRMAAFGGDWPVFMDTDSHCHMFVQLGLSNGPLPTC